MWFLQVASSSPLHLSPLWLLVARRRLDIETVVFEIEQLQHHRFRPHEEFEGHCVHLNFHLVSYFDEPSKDTGFINIFAHRVLALCSCTVSLTWV